MYGAAEDPQLAMLETGTKILGIIVSLFRSPPPAAQAVRRSAFEAVERFASGFLSSRLVLILGTAQHQYEVVRGRHNDSVCVCSLYADTQVSSKQKLDPFGAENVDDFIMRIITKVRSPCAQNNFSFPRTDGWQIQLLYKVF